MLMEIECDDFIQYGIPTGKISFNPGLNVVKGEDNAKNSIGKTTFLQVIDFCFGGNKYSANEPVIENTQCSDIKFAFYFDNKKYYFKRNIKNHNVIYKCHSDYTEYADISREAFCYELKNLYHIENEATFRNMVGRFSRLNNDAISKTQPLHYIAKENNAEVIATLEKIFKKYELINSIKQECKELQKRKKLYSDVKKSGVWRVINKSEYKNNMDRISELQTELDKIIFAYKDDDLSSEINEYINLSALKVIELSLKRKLRGLYSKRSILQREIKNKEINYDIKSIKEYFPNINLKRIEEVQEFHLKMEKILEDERLEELRGIENEIKSVQEKLEKCSNHVNEINEATTIPIIIMKKYADITMEIKSLQDLNNVYDNVQQNKEALKQSKKKYIYKEVEILDDIALRINNEMNMINQFIHGEKVVQPILSFSSTIRGDIKYTFSSHNDSGKGKSYKNIIILDLSIMKLTSLPIIIHDTDMFKNIEYDSQEKILEYYKQMGKQIFIAYDAIPDNYENIKKYINESTVIQLSKDEGSLFGKYWGSI